MAQPNKMLEIYSKGSMHKSNSYGDYVVVEYINANNVIIMFTDTLFVRTTSTKSIKLGVVKDLMKPMIAGVGFIGQGGFKSKLNGKDSKPYSVWRGMIRRCYDSSARGYKFYGGLGVFVCDDWHNFQNFASWYTENYKDVYVNYDLDKDIKSSGDKKYYSPETCSLIPHKANMEEIRNRVDV